MSITFKFDKSKSGKKFLEKGLTEYNVKNCDYFKKQKFGRRKQTFGFYAYDGKKRIGGVQGQLNIQNWVWIDHFFINEAYRRTGIGTQLMKKVEKFAREKKCMGIITDTWDFQAKGFYEKMGFNLWGILKDHPIGTTVYCFKKSFHNY